MHELEFVAGENQLKKCMNEIRKTTTDQFQAGKCIKHFRRLNVGKTTDTPDWSAARLPCAAACCRANTTLDHQRQPASHTA